ncbi:MAG: hypothetical protein MUC81_02710 [Bacteroidia bacterium]|jgi:hypothetical protein|nr:hypothetical protein [Bacteroidia bacterium]
MMNLYSIKTEIESQEVTLLSLFDGATLAKIKNQKAIVGMLKDNSEKIIHSNIAYNPAFIDLFHKTMLLFADATELHVPQLNNPIAYIVDERSTNPDNPEQEDIIGSFEVKEGILLKESYQPNPNYQWISNKGMFKLPSTMEKVLFLALV